MFTNRNSHCTLLAVSTVSSLLVSKDGCALFIMNKTVPLRELRSHIANLQLKSLARAVTNNPALMNL
eukprot:5570359-Pleurochrysis_carterae.AAC.2